jgi:hypothetical protein
MLKCAALIGPCQSVQHMKCERYEILRVLRSENKQL